jgi:hypothetical protein
MSNLGDRSNSRSTGPRTRISVLRILVTTASFLFRRELQHPGGGAARAVKFRRLQHDGLRRDAVLSH